MRKVPDFLKEYLNHPRLVKEDCHGFPLLEPGKFYQLVYSSSRHGSAPSGKVWKCTQPLKHKEGDYFSSCLMTSDTLGRTGTVYYGGQYIWFGKGGNVVIELPEDQQKVYSQFEKALKGTKDDCERRWELRATGCNL